MRCEISQKAISSLDIVPLKRRPIVIAIKSIHANARSDRHLPGDAQIDHDDDQAQAQKNAKISPGFGSISEAGKGIGRPRAQHERQHRACQPDDQPYSCTGA